MRYSKSRATEPRSDEATKGKTAPHFALRRFVASSLRRSPPLRRFAASALRRSPPLRRSHSPGFSLIEIMIVVVIIGLMAGVVTYSTATYLEKAKRQRARSDIATLSGAVDHFYLDNSRYPTNQEGL